MRYLQGTKGYSLTFKHTDSLEVFGYTDSDFAGCVDSRKSTSGYIFILAGGAISWKSSKQTIVATSTMEAEFIACYEATTQASSNLVLEITLRDMKFSLSILVQNQWLRTP
jgi:hypothetical protein